MQGLRNAWQRSFHTSLRLRQTPDFYAALELSPDASTKEIKRQFYALSKTHHPDHNKNDAGAAERFIKISEAYATLGNVHAREAYDLKLGRQRQQNAARGSGFGAAPGGRPASGLSRRRSPFYGPPPSYRSQSARERPVWTADFEVPHFDSQGHFRTQQSQEQRKAQRTRAQSTLYAGNGVDVFMSFFVIGAIVGAALSVTVVLEGWSPKSDAANHKSDV